MALRGWSWDAVAGPAGVGNRPLLEALEGALSDAVVEGVIERTGTRVRRRRLLPTHLVVTLVVAMGPLQMPVRRGHLAAAQRPGTNWLCGLPGTSCSLSTKRSGRCRSFLAIRCRHCPSSWAVSWSGERARSWSSWGSASRLKSCSRPVCGH